ncbi:alpha-1A adrenergic receptor-like [Amphiura filiformis]|uniref:alpha-1A adrenergic receptor-like n=1 Tax=Amphiura filiformis TaxID=82378 RepID=UPI003B21C015
MAMNNTTTNAADTLMPVYILNVPYWEQILLAVLLGLVAIAGLIGNSMIIAAVAFSKKLQTSTNAFVTSLGVADLLTSWTLVWYTVGTLGKSEWPIPGAYWICQLTSFMVYACLGTSIWTLGIIGINRLIHISNPIWYNKIFTPWIVVILVAMTWVIPLASLLICYATGIVTYGYYKPRLVCAGHEDKGTSIFSLVLNVFCGIPFLAIVVSYIWIYVYIKKHFRQQKRRLSQFSIPSSTDYSQSYDMQNSKSELTITEESHDPNSAIAERRRKRISKQEIAITKNLFVVIVGFFACFAPYLILLSFQNVINVEHVLFYLRGVPYINSVINVIIYAMKHPDFKVVLRAMMRCSYADIPQPSPILKYILLRRN